MKLLREIKAKLKFWHGPSLEIGYFGTQRLNYCVEGEAQNYWPGNWVHELCRFRLLGSPTRL